jgi:O-antigen/teichoic acid export membrane protein
VRRILKRLRARDSGLLRESLLALAVRLVGASAGFLMTFAVARTLAPDQAGYFFLALTVIALLAPIVTIGLPTATLRFIGAAAAEGGWTEVRAVTRLSWLWAGASAVLAGLALWLLAPLLAERLFDKPPMTPILKVMAGSSVFVGIGFLLTRQLQGLRRPTQAIVVWSIGIPIGVSAGAFLLPIAGAWDLALVHLGCAAATLGVGLYWWHRAVPAAPRGGFDGAALWASCMPLWVVAIMAAVANWAGQFIAGIWVSPEQIAELAVAQRTAQLVTFVLLAVNLVVAPRFAALHKQGEHAELRRLALHSVRLMGVFATPMVLILCLFPRTILGAIGPQLAVAAPLLVILSLGQLVNVVSGSVGFLLNMTGHERDMRNIVLVSGPFAILAALALIPPFGVTGAAVATALAVSMQNLGAVWMVKRRLGFNMLAIWQRV